MTPCNGFKIKGNLSTEFAKFPLCADPGIFAKGVQAKLPENSSDVVCFCFLFFVRVVFFYNPQLIL